MSSSTAGASWLANDQFLVGSWYLLPDDRGRLASPVGEIDTPCEAVELAAVNAQNGAVLCADATLELTQDGGASWSEAEPGLEPSAIGVAADGYVIVGTADTCGEALAAMVLDVTGGRGGEPECTEAQMVDPAEVAVSAGGGAMWLWAGDDVVVSTEGSE